MLPDGNGFSLMEQLKQKGEYPILFFTAHGEDEDKFKGFGLGADDYVVKPFLPKELTQPKNIFTMADYPSCTAPHTQSPHWDTSQMPEVASPLSSDTPSPFLHTETGHSL